ncbi:hypothetical protein [Rhizobium populisoli]|uniref:hypothetical protein n=1 Tax=Rhizobium populisoli TaxID=2859785 RepID=UPI001FE444BE|nr:hypothetical protein [Rhizobium populisoli]
MKKLFLALSLATMPLVVSPALLPFAAYAAPTQSSLGDLSSFETIARDTLVLVDKGDLAAAQKRITDFETAWDAAQSDLYHRDKTAWGVVDDAADKAISSLRAKKPVAAKAKRAVTDLIAAIQKPFGP